VGGGGPYQLKVAGVSGHRNARGGGGGGGGGALAASYKLTDLKPHQIKQDLTNDKLNLIYLDYNLPQSGSKVAKFLLSIFLDRSNKPG